MAGTTTNSKDVLTTNIDVKTKTDVSPCRITGIAVLPRDKVIVADQFNKKVKLIKLRTGKVIDEIELRGAPWDIAARDDGKVVVTMPDIQSMQRLEVLGSGSIERSARIRFTGSSKCYGVAFAGERMWVSFIDPVKVELMTADCDVLMSFATDASGRGLLSEPHYLAVGPDKQSVYVSDNKQKEVLRVSEKGEVISVFRDGLLQDPTGIAVDPDGTIYVCDCLSHSVLMLTPGSETFMELIRGQPIVHSIAYKESTKQLYVGLSGDVIQILQV